MWRHDQAEPFANNPADENPSGLGTFEFPLRDEGTYFDKETNLLYNWHRYRDLSSGRFIQGDRLGLYGGDLSLYVLRKNNPLSFLDPKGLQAAMPPPRGLPGPRGGVPGFPLWPPKKADPMQLEDPASGSGSGASSGKAWCYMQCDAWREAAHLICRIKWLVDQDDKSFTECNQLARIDWQICREKCDDECK